jgi:hypothetical protein
MLEQVGMRARDDVGAHKFATAFGRFGPGIDGSFDAADIAADEHGHETAANLDLTGDGYACRFDHGIAGFD